MLQPVEEVVDDALEEDVVLPEGVVGVEDEVAAGRRGCVRYVVRPATPASTSRAPCPRPSRRAPGPRSGCRRVAAVVAHQEHVARGTMIERGKSHALAAPHGLGERLAGRPAVADHVAVADGERVAADRTTRLMKDCDERVAVGARARRRRPVALAARAAHRRVAESAPAAGGRPRCRPRLGRRPGCACAKRSTRTRSPTCSVGSIEPLGICRA